MKLEIVFYVILVIVIGLLAYLFSLGYKLNRLEKKIEKNIKINTAN